ncbi:MAG TPA: alpha/beta fold hydrolase [Gemmatimonadaceae bacterium]|nr:alpha/beta fold hydrolase [Gemmatimonadaceae bacterium]
MPLTTTTAVPLFWTSYGPRGAPRLLVLHGGPGASHDYLLPQMLELADRYQLVFYDQRGSGQSRTTDQAPVTWRAHVDDLARLVPELGLEPLSLIGYSWGGLLALLYAIEAYRGTGPRPARMVVIDPAPISRPLRDSFEAEFARRQASDTVAKLRQQLAASGLRERDPEAYRQRAFELSVAGYFGTVERARALTPFRVIARIQKSVWSSLGDYDLRNGLTTVQCPTLVIHGRLDPIPLESSEEAARALPNARLVVLDESGHVPYVEAPDALFAAIRRFLDETASLASPSSSPPEAT